MFVAINFTQFEWSKETQINMELLKQKSTSFPGMKVRVWEILGGLYSECA